MGMAASQARYLQLAARKSNVEFEGQQINQERTILSTESSQFYSQLTALVVPTAPSTSQFTQTKYTFSDGSNNYDITDIKTLNGDPNYNKTVTYEYTTQAYTGIAQRRSDLGVMGAGTAANPYWLTDGATPPIKKTQLKQCTDVRTDPDYAVDEKALLQICKDNPASTLRQTLGYNQNAQTIATHTGAHKYTDANGVVRYYSTTDLNAAEGTTNVVATFNTAQNTYNTALATWNTAQAAYATAGSPPAAVNPADPNDPFNLYTTAQITYNTALATYTAAQTVYNNAMDAVTGAATPLSSYYATNLSKNVIQTANAYVSSADSGRYSSIKLDGYSQSFDLTTNTTINETAYNDAVNEYQYRQQAYTQQVQGINAQISIIQNEDQQLELRLDELDTEQQALATEMDSVKKVIDKNIESTFKAFGD